MSDRDTITRRREEFAAALNRQDIPRLSALRSDDCIDMPPNRPAIRGLDAIRAYWREGFAQAETRFTVLPEHLEIDGDIAVDRFRWAAESAPLSGGASVHDEGVCVWIWHRQSDGEWKLAQAMWNSDLPQGLTVWSGFASAANSALSGEDQETIRDLVELQWTAAWIARDVNKILAMCSEDIVYMPANNPVLRGHVELRTWLEQFPKTLKFTQPVSNLEGDANRAVAHATFDAAMEVQGKSVAVVGKALCTLRKEPSGKWLAQSVCWNFDAPIPVSPENRPS